MEVTAIVIYKGALAHYHVAMHEEGRHVARLLLYSGEEQNQPPPTVTFHKNGRHCEGSVEQDLMDDLCDAVKNQVEQAPVPGPVAYRPQPRA
jgi:hypothetical protein